MATGINFLRISSVGECNDIASVICSLISASSYILGTRPQVDTVKFLALILSPFSSVRSFSNLIKLSKLSKGSPDPITTTLDTLFPVSDCILYIWSSISDGYRFLASPSRVEAQNRQPILQPACDEIHTESPWW